jgi:hypothetical protein
VIWMLSPVIDDQLVRTEVGYCAATAVLSVLLTAVYRQGVGSTTLPPLPVT